MNEFLTIAAPWDLVQSESPDTRLLAGKVVFLAAEGVRITGILLQPFIPGKASQLLDRLGVADDRRSFGYTALRCDPSYGVPKEDPGRGRVTALFPPLVGDIDFRPGRSGQGKRGQKVQEPLAVGN